MAGGVAGKSWLLIMVLQIDSENSATGVKRAGDFPISKVQPLNIRTKSIYSLPEIFH